MPMTPPIPIEVRLREGRLPAAPAAPPDGVAGEVPQDSAIPGDFQGFARTVRPDTGAGA